MSWLRQWLPRKWRHDLSLHDLQRAYHVTFSTPEGQLVLQHLLDTIYCQVYEGTDAEQALAFNSRRSVIHEILQNLDLAEHPDKYNLGGVTDAPRSDRPE